MLAQAGLQLGPRWPAGTQLSPRWDSPHTRFCPAATLRNSAAGGLLCSFSSWLPQV